jgi:hypothetical protein
MHFPIRSIPTQGERSQVPHHKPILKGNQGVGTIIFLYHQQVGHLLNHHPFVDDKLR